MQALPTSGTIDKFLIEDDDLRVFASNDAMPSVGYAQQTKKMKKQKKKFEKKKKQRGKAKKASKKMRRK